jgi:hypothetical protein
MNRYVADWERLAESVKRLMATGLTEDEAKSDLCCAIADGAVEIRLRLRQDATTGRSAGETTLTGADVIIPTRLGTADMDWNNSRPLKSWLVRLGRADGLKGYWDIEWIEVSRAAVTRIFCEAQGGHEHKARNGRPRLRKSSPALQRACQAIDELYPNRVPEQAAEPNGTLCRRVSEKLKQAGLPQVSNDTILRAAGRRK